MNYTLSEDQYNAIDSAKCQLSLVSGLLSGAGRSSDLYTPVELQCFLGAQVDSLQAVIVNVDERYKVEREDGAQMSLLDWLAVIEYMSGTVPPHAAQLKGITDKMNKSAGLNPDMARVLDAWIGALVSKPNGVAEPAVAGAPKARKRDKLASAAVTC